MVAVLDRDHRPLMPCTQKRARLLLERGRAVVHRRYPFTLRLKDRRAQDCAFQPLRLKLDPGSRVTGIAILRESPETNEGQVVHLAQIEHRSNVSQNLTKRRSYRRTRRTRALRHRAPRFRNRTRREGWLPPSLRSRVEVVESWVRRYGMLFPLTHLSVEAVRFDTQLLENPDISGVLYQQGTLAGYELREYLLQKWGRSCAYCGKEGVPLQIEHLVAVSRGGSDRESNLTISCARCNQRKGTRNIEEFLKTKPEVLRRLLAQAKAPLRDAAALNSARQELLSRLWGTGLPVEVGTGGRTKFNRSRAALPKTHAFDALCVGASTPETLHGVRIPVLHITCKGRGRYQRHRRLPTKTHRAHVHAPRRKFYHGFQNGDMVLAQVPSGKYRGRHVAEVRTRSSGSFDLFVRGRKVAAGISVRHCRLLSRFDGYSYSQQPTEAALSSPT